MLRMMTWPLVLLLLWGGGASAAENYPPHRGESPWSFDAFGEEPSSTYIVNDTDSSTLDRYMYRRQGPILIQLPVRRYVGPTDGQGHLLKAEELIKRGIVGRTATLRLPAFDVDRNQFPVVDCDGDGTPDQLKNEEDKLSLNDELLGVLEGDDERWLSQTFEVPISKLKFPKTPGETAINVVKIDIDTANANVVLSSGAKGCEAWAVSVDWVGLSFQASSPVVLVHGIRPTEEPFVDFARGLNAQEIHAVDRSIRLAEPPAPDPLPAGCPSSPYNNSTLGNIRQLNALVPAIAERWGSETLHFVTHSKGGLDVRGFLSESMAHPLQVNVGSMGGKPVKRTLEARSLVTLNTPHRGSVLADLGVEARQLTVLQAARTLDLDVMGTKYFEGSYYCDLMTRRASNFVSATAIPSGTQVASVGTNADTDGNMRINGAEDNGFPNIFGWPTDRIYQLVGGVREVSITIIERSGLDEIQVTKTPATPFRPNDIIVTQESARLYPVLEVGSWHHLNVHSEQCAGRIANVAQKSGGLIDWKVR